MSLAVGSRLGAYEVLSPLGAGGMGEVYRARDTVLKREVALKVLPPDVAGNPERVARFQREAEVLAALNHPNIAHLYGLETSNGSLALVMELVEGETLADRITRGPVPLDEAFSIAKQIAEALEAAHEQGIIHRDLKPANIKVREDGTVKVLDFGLAKAMERASGTGLQSPNVDVSRSPTLTSPPLITGVGMLMGTAAYMSPEQARGRPADKRADVWAFGCVLYEMLTGRLAFGGNDLGEVTAAILRDEPEWSRLPASTSDSVRLLIRGCLEKDPKQRVGDLAVARFALAGAQRRPEIRTPPPAASRWRAALPWTVAAIAFGMAIVTTPILGGRPRTTTVPVRLSANLGRGVMLRSEPGVDIALSRDGMLLAFTGAVGKTSQLFLRRIDQIIPVPFVGTEGAETPFFSPGGEWIGYFTERGVFKVATSGGAPVLVCELNDLPRGGSWSEHDRIVFATREGGLQVVPSAGGKPSALTTLSSDETTQRWPQVLPGGRAVLFTAAAVRQGTTPDLLGGDVVVQALPSGARKVLVQRAHFARYWASGHLTYVQAATLFAVPFDLETLEIRGDAVPLIQGVAVTAATAGVQLAASDVGTVVYQSADSALVNTTSIAMLDRRGVKTPLIDRSLNWSGLSFSPDGNQLAFDSYEGGRTRDVQVYDRRNETMRRFTFDPADDVNPIWSPDGRRIVFASKRGNARGFYNLYWQNADGSGEAQRLTTADAHHIPGGWHPSGRFIAYHEIRVAGAGDLEILPVESDASGGLTAGTPRAFVDTPATEQSPMFSPDGRWIAYHSNETGRDEVYVRPFPGPGGRWQVSTEGGTYPAWSPSKPELMYASRDQQVMVVHYAATAETFRADRPIPWPGGALGPGQFRRFSVHPDGEQIAAGVIDSSPPDATVVVVLNLFDELKRLTAR